MTLPSICFSLVLYNHSLDAINPLLASIESLASQVFDFRILLSVYDGSSSSYHSPSFNQLRSLLPHVHLFFEVGDNIGYGRANNRNFYRCNLAKGDLFVVVNPDIRFTVAQLHPLICWSFAHHSEYSCVAPIVLLEDGSIQYSAKHDPTVLSLLCGRFHLLRCFYPIRKYDAWHRNLYRDYRSELIESSFLSGCLLLIPAWAFFTVGGFCDKFFLHVEDADLVRRLSAVGKTLHNPIGVVVHGWARGSHTSLPQIFSLINSFVIYSFIWGFRLY